MTRHLDPDRIFEDWLADGPTVLPDRVVDQTVRRLAVTPQRTPRLFSGGVWQHRLSAASQAAAVAAVAVVTVVLLLGLPSRPASTPTAAPSAGPATPSPGASAAPEATGPSGTRGLSLADRRILFVHVENHGAGEAPSAFAQILDDDGAGVQDAGSLAEAHELGTLTALADGRVIAVGGLAGPLPYAGDASARAEILDPNSARATRTGSLATPRVAHTATLLGDGRVLVVGGQHPDEVVATAELWDPADGSFRSAGALAVGRAHHTATLLSDGRVLVVGGIASGVGPSLAPAEIWDPENLAFAPAGDLAAGRSRHSATASPGGPVVVVGGTSDTSGGSVLSSIEIWDPALESFAAGGSLIEGRASHSATVLSDDRVLILGGSGGATGTDRLASAEIWTYASGVALSAEALAAPRSGHTTLPLNESQLLVVGGQAEPGFSFGLIYGVPSEE